MTLPGNGELSLPDVAHGSAIEVQRHQNIQVDLLNYYRLKPVVVEGVLAIGEKMTYSLDFRRKVLKVKEEEHLIPISKTFNAS